MTELRLKHGFFPLLRLMLSLRRAQLHIEQGPELEANGTALGIVTAIAAPAALRVRFSGDGGHAGAQLMHRRREPLHPAPLDLGKG